MHTLTPLTPAYLSIPVPYSGPQDVCISPDEAHVYVATYSGAKIYQYSRDSTTGNLTPLTPAYVSTTNYAGSSAFLVSITTSPDGLSIYAGDYQGKLCHFRRDPSTGLLTNALPANPGWYVIPQQRRLIDMLVSPDGQNLYVATRQGTDFTTQYIYQYSRNTTTGALTALSPARVTTGKDGGGLSISADGNFVYGGGEYQASPRACGVYQYSRDSVTGVLTPLSPAYVHAGSYIMEMSAISPDGNFLYAVCYGAQGVLQYSRDPSTGQLTPLTPFLIRTYGVWPYSHMPYGILVSPDGEAVFITGMYNNILRLLRDNTTGLLALDNPPVISYIPGSVYGICGTSNSGFIYATSDAGNKVYQFSRD